MIQMSEHISIVFRIKRKFDLRLLKCLKTMKKLNLSLTTESLSPWLPVDSC